MGLPRLATERLLLRPFGIDDASEVERLAGDRAVADTTLRVPHPYKPGMAQSWISTHPVRFETNGEVVLAVTRSADNSLLGAISLLNVHPGHRADLGYWIGREHWNQGYCTEAARALLKYGFEDMGLFRIYATHLTRNPASGRVMLKVGMTREGVLRRHAEKWGILEDLEAYGILRTEWDKERLARQP